MRLRRRRVRGELPAGDGDLLHLSHHAEQIATQDAAKLGVGVSALGEGVCESGEIGCRVKAFRKGADAVEVRAQADVLGADDVAGVIDVINE